MSSQLLRLNPLNLLSQSSGWLKEHKWVWICLLGALLLGGAYLAGRYTTPTKVVEKTVEKIQYKDRIVTKTEIQKVYVQVQDKDRHKETTTVKTPDGTTTTRVVEDEKTKVTTKDKEQEIKYVDRIQTVDRIVEKEKIVTMAKPNWRMGILAGVDVMTALGRTTQPIPQLGPVTLGLQAERRIVGPFFLGVWGLTSGQVGLNAAIEW